VKFEKNERTAQRENVLLFRTRFFGVRDAPKTRHEQQQATTTMRGYKQQ
jgi:hypothetical protein